MDNMLLQTVEYKVDQTALGCWRRFAYPTGRLFEEFISHKKILGMPLIHFTRGKCPETGRRIIAKGIIAVGRVSVGVIAIGQASVGILAIGQLAIGLLFGLGQLSTGIAAIGQMAIGIAIGIGQITTGYIAVGQFALGHYVLAQQGSGAFVWDANETSAAAKDFFTGLLPQ